VTQDPSPTWQPLSALPLIGSLIEGMLQEAEEHYQTLQKARPQPHVLDDDTVRRVLEVFGAQADDLWLFEEQLSRWQQASPTLAQRQALERLSGQLTRLRGVLASILALAEELKQGTIETVLRKRDIELGLEVLLGKRKL
jgi:hypothetical protein